MIIDDSTELDWIGSIRLIQSAAVSGPVAFGIFQRVIAVPADFELLYAPHERRLALEHEVAHHRSGDLIVNLFAFVPASSGSIRSPGSPTLLFASTRKRRATPGCWTRSGPDRADYGRAIAKAASGRALLFASALDRRNTLHRRLKSMLSNPSSGRRISGRMVVLATIAVAVPLTATRAVEYVDVPVSPAAVRASCRGAFGACCPG